MGMYYLGLFVTTCLAVLGISNAQLLIEVLPGEMPHHVCVQFYNDFWGFHESSASGIILDETHILTVTPFWPLEDLSVVSGITNLLSFYVGLGTRHTIKSVIQHPDYQMCYDPYKPNPSTPQLNNLYIIEVEEPFNFTTSTRKPARLPPANFTIPESGVVTAWTTGGLIDDGLKKVRIPLLNRSQCEEFYGKYRIRDTMFCGAFLDENGDSYDVIDSFDMGAVLNCREDEDDLLSPKVVCGLSVDRAFILNPFCDEPSGPAELGQKRPCSSQEGKMVSNNYPVVFTKISDYVDWINETLNQNKK